MCKNPLNKISNKEKLLPKSKQRRILQKKKSTVKVLKPAAKSLTARNSSKKTDLFESERTYILAKRSKQQKCLTQKNYGEMSQSENIQAGKSYGNGCEIKMLTEKTDIKTLDGNNLNAKGKILKSLTTLIFTVFIFKFHGK